MLWLMALGTERGLRMGSGDEGAKAVGVLERGQ